jgi:calcineurin-like phosphoesterase family protein
MTRSRSHGNKARHKRLGNFKGMLHTGLASHFRAGASRYSETAYDPISAFLPSHLAAWIPHVVRYWFHKRHAFLDYSPAGAGTGIFTIGDGATLSLVGDWGTGTNEAQMVADCVQKFGPDYTIHLGDVYFVGDAIEIKENFLGEATGPYQPVKWPTGKLGSFALCGNHEMYARGQGYFESILPKMGPRKEDSDWGSGQWASFFCLENKYWRILGLDTGYNATRFDWGKMPVFEKSKWLRKSVRFKPTCALPDALLSWLRNAVNPDGDRRGLILLTHHGCYSAFSDWYQIPAQQLSGVIHRPVIWFWGHEHKLAIYDRYHVPGGIEAHGRCIGHGGMPVERGKLPDLDCPWLAWDNRRYENGEDINVGFNGHVNLSLDGPRLHAEYVDVNCTPLFTEDWRVDLGSGELQGPNLKNVRQDPELRFRAVRS